MQEIVYHGSPIDIKDTELKPLGWARHLNQYGVYLTESELVALGYAFDRYKDGVETEAEDFKDISFYDYLADDWKYMYIVKNAETPIGYIYETQRPTEKPVDFYDENKREPVPEYAPGTKAIFAVAHKVKILHKRVVNYNYLKAKPFPIKVVALKKGQDFNEAVKKIQEKLRYIDEASAGNKERAIQEYKQVLEQYTDR